MLGAFSRVRGGAVRGSGLSGQATTNQAEEAFCSRRKFSRMCAKSRSRVLRTASSSDHSNISAVLAAGRAWLRPLPDTKSAQDRNQADGMRTTPGP
jgi:hypothetical protein